MRTFAYDWRLSNRHTVLGSVLVPDLELGLGLPDIATSSEGIEITASANREDLLLHAEVTDPDTGAEVASVALRQLGECAYAANLPAPAGTWRVTVSAVAELPPATVSDLVWVVD